MSLPVLFIAAARETLTEGLHKIEHCVAQLTDEQVWWRPIVQNQTGQPPDNSKNPLSKKSQNSEMNSIANLLLHLSGNMRQWIIAGVGGTKDVRNRPLEFSDRGNRPKSEVLAPLQKTVAEADAILAELGPDQLAENRRIQGFDTNVVAALFNTISHFRGHVQEIIHMTREQLGDKYQFDFVPQGAEQISAGGA
jgi:hypothetical protein